MTRALKTSGNDYDQLIGDIAGLLEAARHAAARAVNAFMTATYWDIGRRIVEFEQGGDKRAAYGAQVLDRLSVDLTARFGRGFSRQNLQNMRQFYLAAPSFRICQTLSGKLGNPPHWPASRKTGLAASGAVADLTRYFPLPSEKTLAAEIEKARELLESRQP
ncbi:MAG: DUF1016 N-terminal domain-containing protein [Kiritimatiellaeota bacterium]|nr:DUF1016 N-terminal domain-containing protein [Kiritimatiellota bacterium]